MGQVGIIIGRYAFAYFGLSSWLLPWFFGVCAWLFIVPSRKDQKIQKLVPLPFIIVSVSLMANLCDYDSIKENNLPLLEQSCFEHGAGGSLGSWLYSGMPFGGEIKNIRGGILRVWIGEFGSWLLAFVILISSLAVHFSFGSRKLKRIIRLFNNFTHSTYKASSSTQSDKPVKNKENKTEPAQSKWFWKKLFSANLTSNRDPLFGDVSQQKSEFKNSPQEIETKPKRTKILKPNLDEVVKEKEKNSDFQKAEKTSTNHLDQKNEDQESKVSLDDGFKVVRAEKTEKATDLFPERKGDYHFPTLDLLMEPPEVSSGGDEDHMIKAKRLKETLSEFKIDVELGEVHTGPVITRYDIHPAAGVRVEKIANLDKNLAMALRAESVRILAPVPGKGCVGVEVPNELAAPVCLKEILQSKAWADANAEIPIVLGKEASGRPLVADLTKMPHLLVAGSTGSGKTVCINAIIASLCYHSSPEDVRFIMVDPKIVEMKVYNDLPHMLIPVVTEPKKVPGALKWLLVEMERRYQIFSKVGVRNIAGFNAKILKDKEEKEKAQLLDAEMTAEERAALSSIQVPRMTLL